MANKDQLKSTLVSLGSLALKVRDRLSESHDQGTYVNLLDEIKQSISNVEEITAALAEEMSEVNEAEVYANVSDARGWQIKLMDRVNFLKSFSANANANVNVNVVPKKKPGRLPEVKLTLKNGKLFGVHSERMWMFETISKKLPNSSTWFSLSRVSPRR